MTKVTKRRPRNVRAIVTASRPTRMTNAGGHAPRPVPAGVVTVTSTSASYLVTRR